MKKSSNWQCILGFSDHYCYSKLAMFGVKTLWKSCSFYLWFITPSLELLLKEIKKISCQFEWCNRDLILLKINPMRWWVKAHCIMQSSVCQPVKRVVICLCLSDKPLERVEVLDGVELVVLDHLAEEGWVQHVAPFQHRARPLLTEPWFLWRHR